MQTLFYFLASLLLIIALWRLWAFIIALIAVVVWKLRYILLVLVVVVGGLGGYGAYYNWHQGEERDQAWRAWVSEHPDFFKTHHWDGITCQYEENEPPQPKPTPAPAPVDPLEQTIRSYRPLPMDQVLRELDPPVQKQPVTLENLTPYLESTPAPRAELVNPYPNR